MDAMMNEGDAISSGGSAGDRALMYPAEPQTLEDLGLPALFLGHLALKHCFYMDFFTLANLSDRLKVSGSIVSEVLEYLKKSKWVEVRGPDPMNLTVSYLSLANRHSLTDAGRKQAVLLLEYDSYAGPAPVVLQDYWRQVTSQTIGQVGVSPDHIQRVLDGLVLCTDVPEQLGVAAVSGKPLFLHGPPETARLQSASVLAGFGRMISWCPTLCL